MKKLILASQSPRRKAILEAAGLAFEVKSISTDETFPASLPPAQTPVYLAIKKAKSLWKTLSHQEKEHAVILAADTIVLLGGKILGKPKDEAHAIAYLKALSGKQHTVITGFCLLDEQDLQEYAVRTEVFFRPLTGEQISFYVQQYQPFDKAGAYAIQEWIGMVGIERIEGDYYNVVGLPISEVVLQLSRKFPTLVNIKNRPY